MIFNIDGKAFDVSNLNPQRLPPYYVQDYITIRHSEPTFTDDEPQLTIYDSIERDLGFGGGVSLQGKITLGNAASTTLNGISLEQEFDWVNQGSTDTGIAEFIYHNSVGGCTRIHGSPCLCLRFIRKFEIKSRYLSLLHLVC